MADDQRRYTHTTKGCYGCGTDVPGGLGLRPYHDGDDICAEYVARTEHRGFSRVVHGGVIAALLDEIITCAASIAVNELAATVSIEVQFLTPMKLGGHYLIRARYTGEDKGRHTAEGAITDDAGRTIAKARGRFVVLTPERAKGFLDQSES